MTKGRNEVQKQLNHRQKLQPLSRACTFVGFRCGGHDDRSSIGCAPVVRASPLISAASTTVSAAANYKGWGEGGTGSMGMDRQKESGHRSVVYTTGRATSPLCHNRMGCTKHPKVKQTQVEKEPDC